MEGVSIYLANRRIDDYREEGLTHLNRMEIQKV
jgi:hypothetical protein